MARAPIVPVETLNEAAEVVGRLCRAEGVVVVDLENTLIPTGAVIPECIEDIERGLGVLRSRCPTLGTVIATNRRLTRDESTAIPGTVVGSARKPAHAWLRDARLVVAVVGDQLMTDGRLARRLGVPFIWLAGREAGTPIPSRLVNMLLGLALRATFNRSP